MSGFTDWLRSMQRTEAEIRADERSRIAADLDRRADGIDAYLLGMGSEDESDENRRDMALMVIWLHNTAASLRGDIETVNQREPDRAP